MTSVSVMTYLADNWAWALGLAAFMFGLTSFASLLNQDRRDDVALWLMGEHASSWSQSFIRLFDAVFGKNHFSVRCFFRSATATLVAVLLIWLLMGSADTIGLRMRSDMTLGSVLVIGLIINLLADYVSLLETRWLLGKMPRSIIGQILVLIFDLAVSALIIWIAIFAYINSPLHVGEIETFAEILGVFSIFSVFFYSTFLTSVWTWAYIVSTWLMRLAMRLRVSYWLDVEGKPIKVLFLLLALGVGGVSFAGSLVFGSIFARQQDGVSFADRTLCTVFKGKVCLDVAELGPTEQAQLEFMTLACESGVTNECLRRAGATWEIDVATAAQLWLASCRGGDAHACSNVGYLLTKGLGFKLDYPQAIRFYQKGCDLGYGGGCTDLGHIFEKGLHGYQDYGRALKLYETGCRLGSLSGCTNLGYLHGTGLGTGVNFREAHRFYRFACDRGEALGCTNLGHLYQQGLGVEENPVEASYFFRKGCDGGDSMGCYHLGVVMQSDGLDNTDLSEVLAGQETSCVDADDRPCKNANRVGE